MARVCPALPYSRVRSAHGHVVSSALGRIVAAVVAAVVGAVPAAWAQTPGGVAGSALWVKANQGVQATGTNQVEQWLDQSGSGNTTTELRAASPAHTNAITPTDDILWVPGSINFNPAIDFSAAPGRSLKGNAASNWTTGALSIFAVAVTEAFSSGGNYGAIWDAHANWTTGTAGVAGAGIVHSSQASNGYWLDGNGCFVAVTPSFLSLTQPRVVRGVYVTGNNALNGRTALDGVLSALGTNCSNVATTFFEVGGRTAGDSILDARIFNGKIAEVVVFKSDLPVASDQRVESYLALKYGITLRRINLGGAENYLTSTGATVWSGQANAAYHNAVAGIAADSGSALDQRVSQSTWPGDQIAIAAGSFTFAGTVTAQSPAATIGDQSALVWGHNNQTTAANVTITDPATQEAGVEFRMARVWRTQATGSGLPSQVTIRIPATLIETLNPSLRNPVLLISTAATFSTVTRTPIPLTKTGAFYFATFTTFTPNEFFTIGGIVTVPDLSITKAAPGVMPAGANVTYTLTVTNTSTVFANNAVVTDMLPATLTFVSSTPACSAIGQTVTCSLGTLSPGQSLPIALTVQVGPDVPAGTIIDNTANVSHADTDPTPANNTSTVSSPPVTTSADLSTTKAAVEASVTPGATFTYQIVVTNNGPATALNVRATDTLPAPLAFVSSSSNCTAVGQDVTCGPEAEVDAGGSATFTIVVRLDPSYTGNGSDINNVATTDGATFDPNLANNPSAAAPPPAVGPPQSDLQIVKHVSAAAVTPGTNYTYTLQVTNNGPSTAVNVRTTDPLPAQATFVSSAAGCTAAGQLVSCPVLPTLAVGATQTFDIVVQLNPAYTGNGTDILNSGTVASDTTDPQPQNNANPAGAPPVGPAGADVTVVKTVSAGPVNAGQTFTYTLLVSNQGPSAATDVVVTDPLPAGVTFVSSPEGCTAVGQDVTCPTIATLNPGGSVSYQLVVRLDSNYTGDGSDLPNVASVASPTPDPTPGNNTSPPVTPTVGAGSAELSVTKTVLSPSVSAGLNFTYRIVVSNGGPSTARTVQIADSLPAPLQFVSSPSACTAAGQVVTCTQPTLAAGASATFDLLVQLDPAYAGNGSDLQNTATATSSTTDSDTANNAGSTGPLTIGVGSADLSISMAGPFSQPGSGSELTYTITVTNLGPNAATDVMVQDQLPTGLAFVATSGDCTTPFPCALGTLLPGQARTIVARFTLLSGAPLVITNIATLSSMTPDSGSGNNSATASTPASPLTYSFAEGATGTFWDTDLLFANPTDTAAPVTIRFLKESGEVVTRTLTVAPLSHGTMRVDEIPGLESALFSAQVTSDLGVPLAVERTMTWDGPLRYAGHTEAAVTRPATRWYFAEGSGGYFTTFLLLENPGDSPVDVTITFLREFLGPFVQTVTIGAHARYTLEPTAIPELASDNFGIVVEATQPVVAERSMYFGTIPTRLWSGGHSSAGVTEPAQQWFYAEGATGAFFDTFILLSNPQMVPANVTLEYLLSDGTVVPVTKIVPAQGRITVQIDFEADPRLHNAAISTRIVSDVPIVTERSMYWGTKLDVFPWSEGHNSFGLAETSLRWALAEGRVGGATAHHTYILLSNPWTTAAEVTVSFLRDNGVPVVKSYTVPPTTRYTIDVNSAVPELQGESFGARIEVTNGTTINVERSMYWDGNGVFWTAGTNALGTKLP